MQKHAPNAVVLSHVAFEDLGSLAAPLKERGFSVEWIDVSTAEFPLRQTTSCDLLIVLGGPISVYDQAQYPFLAHEIELIRQRLAADRALLGICLGAQLMAAALGADVYAGERGAEIGWSPLLPAPDAPDWFAPLLADRLAVLHWHGDTFDLPRDAQRLAGTELYPNQAFSIGKSGLGLQFHPEATAKELERWYVGHACELNHAGIAPNQLRVAAQRHGAALEEAAARFWNLWLDQIL